MTAKLLIKRSLGTVWRQTRLNTGQRRLILLYHSVGGGPFATPADTFRRQIEWLCANAQVVSLRDLIESENSETVRIALTFDDGYGSLHEVARPILDGLGCVATVFLNTGWVGDTVLRTSDAQQGHTPNERFLSWREVADLASSGWTMGSHGVDHLDLVAAGETLARLQLKDSKAKIERTLGMPCSYFAYTWGRNSKALHRLVADCGYARAFTTAHRPVGAREDPMAIPRVNVSIEYSMDDFTAIVRGDWDYIDWVQRLKLFAGGALPVRSIGRRVES